MSALKTQEGGDHYTKLAIQPMEYSMANKLDACQHTAIKYITRFRDKNGKQDLLKAIHVLQMLIEFEYGKDNLQQLTDMSQELQDYRTGEAWPVETHGLPTNIVQEKEFIDWGKIDKEFKYLAKDKCGEICCYSHKPIIHSGLEAWSNSKRDDERGATWDFATHEQCEIPGDWKQSLRKRPK